MSVKLANHISTKKTPQTEQILGENQVKNNAGGYVYELSDWKQLERFLILGTEGGSYYASESKMTKNNATNIINLIKKDGPRVVQIVSNFSNKGKAYKNDYALFVLALAITFGDKDTKTEVKKEFNTIVRTGTHLFTFTEYVKQLRGFGRSVRSTLSNWYTSMSTKDLAYQITKYQQRNEWSHIDVLNIAHPKSNEADKNAVFNYIINGGKATANKDGETSELTRQVNKFLSGNKMDRKSNLIFGNEAWKYIKAVEEAKTANEKRLIELIEEYKLPREVIPTEKLSANVYRAMLPHMPMTALIRNLATMTRLEIIKPLAQENKIIIEKLHDVEYLKKARIHPIQIIAALLTYQQGYGSKDPSKKWTPVQQIVDALDDSFYLSFDTIEPTGKNYLIALDISGSMTWGTIGGVPGLTPRIASAVLAMVTAWTEQNYHIVGFSHNLIDLNISPKMRLDNIVKYVNNLPFGGTDCSLPMQYALDNKLDVDAFLTYTDNETWYGKIHPSQALRLYRQKMNKPNAKMVVCGMTATQFSIADPKDPNSLDVVGFSTDTPSAINEFIRF